MPNTREKLIELLREVQYQGNAVHGYHDRYIQNGELADHLIANGVTVQDSKGVEIDPFNKWISVKDRLPKPGEKVLTYRKAVGENYSKIAIDYIFVNEGEPLWSCDVGTWKTVATHWMPLPQPPKGE